MRDYPAARFKYIVLAGSVVRRDYDWLKFTQPNPNAPGDARRVVKVLNYVATRDWVVALFSKSLQPYRWFNLGGAGQDGFRDASPGGPIHEVKYIVGNHSAGHEEQNWNDIAQFIVSGKVPEQKYPPYSKTQNRFWCAMGRVSFITVPFIVLAILGFGFLLLWSIFATPPCWAIPCLRDLTCSPYLRDLTCGFCTTPPTGHDPAWRAIGFFVYLWSVYLFATRF